MTFAGAAYDPRLDRARLTVQVERIRAWALARDFFTLREAREALERLYAPTFFPEGSISAQLRNLEKPEAGRLRCKKEKRRRAGISAVWEYRLRRPAQLELLGEKNDQAQQAVRATPNDPGSEPDDGRGREEFFQAARRIVGSLDPK
jgi:hypothetical protein